MLTDAEAVRVLGVEGLDRIAVLALIADLTAEGEAISTQTLAEAARFHGHPVLMACGDPYGGLRKQIGQLEADGLLDVGPGAAEATTPGQAAAMPEELYVMVTPAGRDALEPRNSA